MKKIIRLTENDLNFIVKKVLEEQRVQPSVVRGQKDKEEIIQIQQSLSNLGFDLGKTGPNKDGVDGNFGPRTQKAVKEFQTKMGLNPNGIVDQQTKNYLFQGSTGFPLSRTTKTQQTPTKDKEKTKTQEIPAKGEDKESSEYLNCVKNSPKRVDLKDKQSKKLVIKIDDHYFYPNFRVKKPNGVMGRYFCYKEGVKIKDDSGGKTYLETGVKTENIKTSRFEGGVEGFFRKTYPNIFQLFFTKPLTEKDFTESQKEVMFDVIQNAVEKGGENTPKSGCVTYKDYPDSNIDRVLNKAGGASTLETWLGTGLSDQFRVATTMGQFCYKMQSDGSYVASDLYDFHKWSSFTVKPQEVKGMSYTEKMKYIMDKTGLSPYAAARHIGWLEHPESAPEETKTKIVVKLMPGYFVKNKQQSSGKTSDMAV